MSKRLLILGMVCLVVEAKVFLVETAPGKQLVHLATIQNA